MKVGLLRPSFTAGRILAAASFEYDATYLTRPGRYEISPDLPLTTGRVYTAENQNIFGAFADASPDEWGQRIIEANHAVRVKNDPALPRRIGDFDFLLGVSDRSRMGALRFRHAGRSEWLSDDPGVANMHDLERILAATKRYETHQATDDDVEYLAKVATSPGGARPKANALTSDGDLSLAKLRRFDRDAAGNRIGYMSAATALGIGKHDSGQRVTYEEFADTLAEFAEEPERELREMYGRIALTVLVNNVDDHWRNHGFLRSRNRWRLSPIFDVNPESRHGVIHSRAINDEDDPRHRDIRNLVNIADVYGLTHQQAISIIRSVADEVAKWPEIATNFDIQKEQRSAMANAFDDTQFGYIKEMESGADTTTG